MKATRTHTYSTLDLFCGCGGLTEGFHQAGNPDLGRFRAVAGVDIWERATESFRLNFDAPAITAGVGPEILELPAVRGVPRIDVVVGGPPCQGFSTSGKRSLEDPRNLLVKRFFEVVREASPQAFIMENVSGFTNFNGGRTFLEVCDLATALGYEIHAAILLASAHGVPQRRRRFFLVGTKGLRPFHFPGVSSGCLIDGALVAEQRVDAELDPVSFDDAISDLPEIDSGEQSTEYRSPPVNEFQRLMRQAGLPELVDHVAPRHRGSLRELMAFIPPGYSAFDAPVFERVPIHLRPTSGFPNSYARIRGDLPAPTITRNFTTPSSANCIHPRLDRALTLREGARCQSFRDDFRFAGTFTDKRLLIGNAVPPLMARALGQSLLRALSVAGQGIDSASAAMSA